MQKKFLWRVCLLIGLIALCAVLVLSLCLNIRTLKQSGGLRPSRVPFKHHNSIPKPADIQDWMTFGYVNYLFRLPESYLKEKLTISQNNYQNLRISSFAKNKGLATDTALEQIRTVVADFGGSAQ